MARDSDRSRGCVAAGLSSPVSSDLRCLRCLCRLRPGLAPRNRRSRRVPARSPSRPVRRCRVRRSHTAALATMTPASSGFAKVWRIARTAWHGWALNLGSSRSVRIHGTRNSCGTSGSRQARARRPAREPTGLETRQPSVFALSCPCFWWSALSRPVHASGPLRSDISGWPAGAVRDADGVIPGSDVVLIKKETNLERTVITNADGE